MLRNCGTQDGELYKPDSMNMGGFEMDGAGMGGSPPSDMPGGFAASQFSGERPEGGEASEGGSSGGVPEDSGGFAFEGGAPAASLWAGAARISTIPTTTWTVTPPFGRAKSPKQIALTASAL